MNLQKNVYRLIYLSIGYLLTSALILSLVACNTASIPKNQTAEGTCKSNFIESYNKIKGTEFQPNAENEKDIQNTCRTFLKTYGKVAEDCTAYNPADGSATNLNAKDVRKYCASKLQGNYY